MALSSVSKKIQYVYVLECYVFKKISDFERCLKVAQIANLHLELSAVVLVLPFWRKVIQSRRLRTKRGVPNPREWRKMGGCVSGSYCTDWTCLRGTFSTSVYSIHEHCCNFLFGSSLDYCCWDGDDSLVHFFFFLFSLPAF